MEAKQFEDQTEQKVITEFHKVDEPIHLSETTKE